MPWLTDSLFSKISGLVLGLAAIGSLTYLAATGVVSGEATVAVIVGVLGIGGGAAVHQSGVKSGARATQLGQDTNA